MSSLCEEPEDLEVYGLWTGQSRTLLLAAAMFIVSWRASIFWSMVSRRRSLSSVSALSADWRLWRW